MEKEYFKLGSIKSLLTSEEMKKIAGGYNNVCCCVDGPGTCCPTPWCSCELITQCDADCYSQCDHGSGMVWGYNSPCNYCTSETC
jgi:hypothetical protein